MTVRTEAFSAAYDEWAKDTINSPVPMTKEQFVCYGLSAMQEVDGAEVVTSTTLNLTPGPIQYQAPQPTITVELGGMVKIPTTFQEANAMFALAEAYFKGLQKDDPDQPQFFGLTP